MAEANRVTHNDRLIASLRSNVSPAKWSTWFSGVHIEVTHDTLSVIAPSDFHSKWLQDHYRQLIKSLAREHLGPKVDVAYMTRSKLVGEPAGSLDPATAANNSPPKAAPNHADESRSRLMGKYVFDNFVGGQSNRLALAAAMAVAEKPGQHYNPLFLYGAAGLGKTHLLYAIGHQVLTLRSDASVRCINSETFFNEFVDGIRRKRMGEFKHRYRNIDLLLLDDVQFFQGKEQVLEELFHTFNTLHQSDRQMVLTCDRPPKDLGIEERIRSRFQWGLLADIGPPDVETRLAILRRNADYAPVPVPPEVLEFISKHITDNIRELEGALTKVTAFAALTQQQLTLDLAKEQLKDLIPTPANRPPTPYEIISLVAASYGVSLSDMEGPSRREPLVTARQIAMYLCRDLTELSLPKIGGLLGGRDHSTILHGINKISKLLNSDPEFSQRINMLSTKLCSA